METGFKENGIDSPRTANSERCTMRSVTQNEKVKFAPITFEDPEYGEDLKNEIAARAYEIFDRRGRLPGHDVKDWLEAESQVHWELH